MPRDRWRELCAKYQNDDGLLTRKVGLWTEEKLYFWNRYVEITTSAMVGHPKWPAGLVYIDLFAGPGVCELKQTGRRIPGSVLIAANAPKPFRRVLACELHGACADALAKRLSGSLPDQVWALFRGDCNRAIHEVVKHVPAGALSLAFVDPEDLRVDFSTVRALASCGRVDLLILFMDRMDIVRNVDRYERQRESALDRMLGPQSAWREKWSRLDNRSPENICRLFADEYKGQLARHLGYRSFGERVMRSSRAPLYRLIFASKSDKGLEFWDKVTRKERSGQTSIEF
jgi:three-Cys-motif partner protein